MSGEPPERPPRQPPAPRAGVDRARSEPGRGSSFGSARWAFEPRAPVPGEIDEPENRSRGGFGGSHWEDLSRPIDLGLDVDAVEGGEGDESGERGARRKRGPAPHPYPRKVVASLGADVRVTRDASGLAHISARAERDAYCALGLVMAQDRLWQLDLLRRLAHGRSAEVLGAAAVGHDATVRTMGIGRRALALARRLDGLAHETLAAFTAGVNAVRGEGAPAESEALGLPFDPWTIADSLAIEILWGWWNSLSTWPEKLVLARVVASSGLERARWLARGAVPASLIDEERLALWRRLDLRLLDLLSLPGAGGFLPELGGNAWAATPSATGDRGPAVVGCDPHLPIGLPGPMYAVHLEAPGFAVVGATLVGSPAVVMGRNRAVAWGFSPARVDDADCIIEEIDGIGRYREESGWGKLQSHSEVIRVRDGDAVRIEVSETPHGPLLGSAATQILGPPAGPRPPGLALRWTGGGQSSGLGGWLAIARATSIDDVASAVAFLDRGPLPVHVVAGDAAGRVGSWLAGAALERDPVAACVPVMATRPEGRWGGVSGLSKRAALEPVPGGHAGLAVVTDEPAIGDGGHVPVLPTALARPRAQRATDALSATAGGTRDAMARLQLDTVDPWTTTLGSLFAAAACPADGPAGDPRRVLAGWSGEASIGSVATPLLLGALLRVLPAELFPEGRYPGVLRLTAMVQRAVARVLTASTSPWFPEVAARDEALGRALEGAMAQLEQAHGPDPAAWQWGALQRIAPRHALADREQFSAGAPEPVPTGGTPFSVLRVLVEASRGDGSVATAAACRLVADLATDEAWLALPCGQSGVVTSPNFRDQAAAWAEGRLLTVKLGTQAAGTILDLVGG